MLLLKLRTFIALIVVIAFFAVLVPNFLSVANLMIMSKHVAINAFLAVGMTFVIITGGIDLSVGSIVGLAGMVAGALILHGLPLDFLGYTLYFNIPEIVIITLFLGVVIGSVNGFLITRLNVAPFIATLGMLYVARGMALLSSGGKTFPNLEGTPELGNTGFPWLGAGSIAGIPVSIVVLTFLALGAAYLSRHTPLGRHIYAVGGNEVAARLSGIKVNRTKMFVYMFSGFCAAIAGLIVASQLVASHPATGNMFELNAIAAAVLGGTSMAGGRGRIGGTIIGAFVIGILSDGLVMMGVSSFWQMVIKGVVIVGAVVIDQIQRDLQRKAALQQNQEQ
ncbi:ABC transporter permease [Cohaesibacter celericrescens]|nr:ABC transporter permease [Cohaesibacter celericrescens]